MGGLRQTDLRAGVPEEGHEDPLLRGDLRRLVEEVGEHAVLGIVAEVVASPAEAVRAAAVSKVAGHRKLEKGVDFEGLEAVLLGGTPRLVRGRTFRRSVTSHGVRRRGEARRHCSVRGLPTSKGFPAARATR